MMRFPTQAIRYPPLAATLSTATVRRIWRDRMRWSCDAASPCSWTRPPEFSSRSSTSSSGVAIVSTAVTSSRSEETAVALMRKASTNSMLSRSRTPRAKVRNTGMGNLASACKKPAKVLPGRRDL